MDDSGKGKTPEEIEAEERARLESENFAAVAALAAVGIEHLIKRYQEQPTAEPYDETDEDYGEDEDSGFTMTM